MKYAYVFACSESVMQLAVQGFIENEQVDDDVSFICYPTAGGGASESYQFMVTLLEGIFAGAERNNQISDFELIVILVGHSGCEHGSQALLFANAQWLAIEFGEQIEVHAVWMELEPAKYAYPWMN